MAEGVDIQDYAKLNEDVIAWSNQSKNALKSRIAALSIGATGKLMQKLSFKLRYQYGHISKIGFGFQRYGVFVEKGAGKGMGGDKGSKWYDGKGGKKSTNPASIGKMNTGSRRAKPWFNPVIEAEIEELADIIIRDYKDLVFDKMKYIMDAKIK